MRLILKLKVNYDSLRKRKLSSLAGFDSNKKYKIVNTTLYTEWLKENGKKYHEEFSTYNHSGIIGGHLNTDFGNQIVFNSNGLAEIKISSLNQDFLFDVLLGISKNPIVEAGNFFFDIIDVQKIEFTPSSEEMKFFTISPIFIQSKERVDGKRKHYTFKDDLDFTSKSMVNTLKNRIDKLGLKINTDNLEIVFDSSYEKAKIRNTYYEKDAHVIKIQGSLCPIIVRGSKEAIQAAYYLGVGQSTGAGFGCLEIWSNAPSTIKNKTRKNQLQDEIHN